MHARPRLLQSDRASMSHMVAGKRKKKHMSLSSRGVPRGRWKGIVAAGTTTHSVGSSRPLVATASERPGAGSGEAFCSPSRWSRRGHRSFCCNDMVTLRWWSKPVAEADTPVYASSYLCFGKKASNKTKQGRNILSRIDLVGRSQKKSIYARTRT
jgi:hypothetical protein